MKQVLSIHSGLFLVCVLLLWGCGQSTDTDTEVSTIRPESEKSEQATVAEPGPVEFDQTGDSSQAPMGEPDSNASSQSDPKTIDTQAAKTEVDRAITSARTGLKEVRELMSRAPSGKDSELVLEIMDGDLRAAESTLTEISSNVTADNYEMLKQKVAEVESVVARIRDQILQAIRTAETAES